MGDGKADGDNQGWFARWREQRVRKKQRAIEIRNRMYEERNRMYEERARNEGRAKHPPPGGGA